MAGTNVTARNGLTCVVVTPEATVVDTPADFVALPLQDGEIGIAPGRSPLIGRLGYGELRIRNGEAVTRYYVDGGFVQVVDNAVSVLTNRAIPSQELDSTAASEQLRSALSRRAAGREEMAIRDRLISRARGQLRVARHAATSI
jgi:F-type H+-transporting ATPase subunit epsilon